jgi:hypothetical protein
VPKPAAIAISDSGWQLDRIWLWLLPDMPRVRRRKSEVADGDWRQVEVLAVLTPIVVVIVIYLELEFVLLLVVPTEACGCSRSLAFRCAGTPFARSAAAGLASRGVVVRLIAAVPADGMRFPRAPLLPIAAP